MSALRTFVSRWWCVLLLVALWYVTTAIGLIKPQVIPPPGAVIAALGVDPLGFVLPTLRTLGTAAVGLVLGVSVGYAMAALTWLTPTMNGMLLPLALILRSVPFVALVPVLARLFGYGVGSTLVICSLVCFFPTFVLVSSGLRDIPANSDDLFRVLGAGRRERFRQLAVPASIPSLGTAIRISSGTSILAALVAEFIMGTDGLARVLINALGLLQVDKVWAASLIAIVLSVTAFIIASWNENRWNDRWR